MEISCEELLPEPYELCDIYSKQASELRIWSPKCTMFCWEPKLVYVCIIFWGIKANSFQRKKSLPVIFNGFFIDQAGDRGETCARTNSNWRGQRLKLAESSRPPKEKKENEKVATQDACLQDCQLVAVMPGTIFCNFVTFTQSGLKSKPNPCSKNQVALMNQGPYRPTNLKSDPHRTQFSWTRWTEKIGPMIATLACDSMHFLAQQVQSQYAWASRGLCKCNPIASFGWVPISSPP